eukprot:COSAG01_NODE_24433_length_779_cov_0.936765_1_plen_188_part_01
MRPRLGYGRRNLGSGAGADGPEWWQSGGVGRIAACCHHRCLASASAAKCCRRARVQTPRRTGGDGAAQPAHGQAGKPQPSTTHGAVRRLHRGVAPGNQGRRWLRPRSAGPGGRTLKYRSCGRIVRLAAPALRTTRSLSQASRHQLCPIATRRSDRPQPGGSGRSATSSSGLRWCWADIVESIAGAVRV